LSHEVYGQELEAFHWTSTKDRKQYEKVNSGKKLNNKKIHIFTTGKSSKA